MKVLIVDDTSVMRKILRTYLGELKITDVTDAANGKQGLEAALKEDYDLIFSDWNMPEMTGIEFLKAIKTVDKYKPVPVIMVTTEAEKPRIVEAISSGAAGYILKPYDGPTLHRKVRSILANTPLKLDA
jgi:two-component system, chemotaxis family, chemotaxis protein CheY